MRDILVALVRWLAAALDVDLEDDRQQDQWWDTEASSPIDRQALRAGGKREVDVHRVGPPISEDGLAWESEETEYFVDSVNTRVRERTVRLCDCNAAVGYNRSIVGRCSVPGCGRVVCEDCGSLCDRCGDVLCGRHAVRLGERVFCPRHRWLVPWLAFWRWDQ